ncbi:hypothetical protein ACFWM1_11630 [Nocardia sp. NPDC058379]|uniref:hypothetical protein n=1 Tax=unclassified Nocardia TaxID=2637762 RepID=UPI0036522172
MFGEASVQRIPIGYPAESLVWDGDDLVDPVGGHRRWDAAGAETGRCFTYGSMFDRAIRSPSGAYTVIYAELGTKGLVLDRDGRIVREIDRSYYCAEDYEYPVALGTLPDGREVIAHCPDEYNQLHLETVADGVRLTGPHEGAPSFFHSRLAFSPDGRRLISAGWVWHPWSIAQVYDVEVALGDASSLDEAGLFGASEIFGEVESACWLDADRVAVASSPDANGGTESEAAVLGDGQLGVWSISQGQWVSRCRPDVRVGTVHSVLGGVLGLYGHPKVIDPATGAVIAAWPELDTGEREFSICHARVPAVAVHPSGDRFAVASPGMITVVRSGG